MDVVTLAPTPGSAAPGNLYADLQSRTLWLGVDLAVDPAGAVLISDIVALQAADATTLTNAKAYTDTQITTRAPTVHTHTSSQITDFATAVGTVVAGLPGLSYTRGMIMMYSGSLADIGVGPLAGWHLCDGAAGTPDLRDRFVVGAGNKAIGAVNPNASVATDNQGSHIHVNDGTAITGAQMPYHSHGGSTGYVSSDHSHFFNVNTGGESTDHVHSCNMYLGDGGRADGFGMNGNPTFWGGMNTNGRNVGHYHNVQGNTGGISSNHYHGVNAEGGNQSHTHTMQYAGVHAHTIASTALRDAIPYYALAFIMKT